MNPEPTPAYDARFTIFPQALETIRREASQSLDGLETGGILLGTHEPHIMEVRAAGEPGPGAIRRPDFFLRDLQHAQQLADHAWQTHRSQWLGEWHTHLNGGLTPSPADMHAYLQHLQDPELGFQEFACLIVAFDAQQTALAAWIVDLKGARPAPITLIDQGDRS